MSDNEEQTAPMGPQAANVIQIPVNLPLPSPLVMTGNLATNWKRFYRAWNNYEIAARLKDTNNPGTNKELRTATLLTCIGADALDVFDGLDFANEDDRKDIDVVVNKLEKYCIGETNETYERYCFNKRDQQSNETADGYYTALRTLAKTCNFGNLEDNLIRDRIVMGIKDNSTRKKLLQVSKLTLQQSIDICRSCEKTSKQLESMTAEGEQLFAVRREQSREQNPRRRNEKRVEEALSVNSATRLTLEINSNAQHGAKYAPRAKERITSQSSVRLKKGHLVNESRYRASMGIRTHLRKNI